jgi:hypothetical protein
MTRMQDGDTLEISPGAIFIPGNNDGSTYLEGGCFHIWKSCTVRNMTGRGRWRLGPKSSTSLPGYTGIVIREPNQTYAGVDDTQFGVNARKTIVIEGFDADNWGTNADDKGVHIRADRGERNPAISVNDWHAFVTLRNFKLGKPTLTAGSGIAGPLRISRSRTDTSTTSATDRGRSTTSTSPRRR